MQTQVPVEAERAEAPGPRQSLRWAQRVLFVLPVAWVLAIGWRHRWMTEDGFIYLRIVRQIRVGNGPVFNAGDRVEAYTGPLWVAILSLADLVAPVRLEWLSIVLGLAATAAGVALSLVGARRLAPPEWRGALFVPLGALVFVALYPVWAYATSGLETGLVFAWLGGCLWVLARWVETGATLRRTEAVLLGLGWLVRPELALYSAAFVALVLLATRRQGWRAGARVVVWAALLPLAYQVFRMGYFGSVVPNTAIAKEGTSSQWDRGWRYLRDLVDPYLLWIPVLGLVAGGYGPLVARARDRSERRRIAVAGVFAGCGVVNVLYVVAVGGDYHHARLFLPALFALCAPVAAVPVRRQHVGGLLVAAWAVVAVLTLRPEQTEDDWLANGFLAPQTSGKVTTDDYGWGEDGPARAWFDRSDGRGLFVEAGVGRYPQVDLELRSDVPDPTVAAWGIGVLGYSLGPDVHVIDLLGLADPLTAHLESTPSPPGQLERFPGHEKPLPTVWLAARATPDGTFPPADALPSFGIPLIPPTTGEEHDVQVAWARATLACDAVADLRRSSEGDLTPRRVLGNLVRAVPQSRLRIPPDPEEAYRELCGDGIPDEVRRAQARTTG
jgi:arabinofuranosyltransferase